MIAIIYINLRPFNQFHNRMTWYHDLRICTRRVGVMGACGPPSGGERCAQYIAELRLVRHELFCFIFILSRLAFFRIHLHSPCLPKLLFLWTRSGTVCI